MAERRLGKYLTLEEFCTCTQTYQRFAHEVDPFPKNLEETLPALEALCPNIIDPMIDGFGRDSPSERLRQRFLLTFGFCSPSVFAHLRFLLRRSEAVAGEERPSDRKEAWYRYPSLDQHMAHEMNWNGWYFCQSMVASCDFRILGLPSDELVDWIVAQGLPFDSLYFYGAGGTSLQWFPAVGQWCGRRSSGSS